MSRFFEDNTDGSKKLDLDVSNISTSTTRTWTAPDWDGTVGVELRGTGSPEGSVIANVGREYIDESTGLRWQKRSGTGNTGWSPSASAIASEPTTGFGSTLLTYTFDALEAQVLTKQIDGDINTLEIINLELVGTAILAIEVSTVGAGGAILALDANISLASGALGDIGTAAGSKGTFFFWWDAINNQSRVSIVAG